MQAIDSKIHDFVYKRFKDELNQNKDGSYENGLLWEQIQKFQPENNKAGSICRLSNLITKLQKDEKLFNHHDEIIQDQMNKGIMEIPPKVS